MPSFRYKDKIIDILERARKARVAKIINVGTSLRDNEEVIKVAESFENVYAAVGVYPNSDRERCIRFLKSALEKQIRSTKKIVAIGECGIDFTNWKNQRLLEEQIELFEMQAGLALKYDLPLAVHNRNGDCYLLSIFRKYKNLRGVLHCFSSGWQFAQQVLKFGFYISFSGFITHPSKSYLLKTVARVPDDRFVIETDSPFIVPRPSKDKQNEPKNVKIVTEKIAETRGDSFLKIAKQTTKNAERLFRFKTNERWLINKSLNGFNAS